MTGVNALGGRAAARDQVINITDVTLAFDAFQGDPYAFAPSTTTPCP